MELTPLIHWLAQERLGILFAVLVAENALIFVLSLGFGAVVSRLFRSRRVVRETADRIPMRYIAVALYNVVQNALVTFAGLYLWRAGIIRFRDDMSLWALLDTAALLLVMDFTMYWLHRIAHHPLLYPLAHRLHHEIEEPYPLSLFVLHPLENMGFGVLWLLVITLYPASWLGMSLYLALNVFFGTIGHTGVEPFPSAWTRIAGLRWIAGGTFHTRHHQVGALNFGFYTLLWDRVFGTLRAGYEEDFARAPQIQSSSIKFNRIDDQIG